MVQLTPHVLLASAGMQAERETLHRVLKMRMSDYEHEHRKAPSLEAVAQLLSTMLYHKRFFPYYTFNVLAARIDSEKQWLSRVEIPRSPADSNLHRKRKALDKIIQKLARDR